MNTNRRGFLAGLGALIAASAVKTQAILSENVFVTMKVDPLPWHHYAWTRQKGVFNAFVDGYLIEDRKHPIYDHPPEIFDDERIELSMTFDGQVSQMQVESKEGEPPIGEHDFTLSYWMKRT